MLCCAAWRSLSTELHNLPSNGNQLHRCTRACMSLHQLRIPACPDPQNVFPLLTLATVQAELPCVRQRHHQWWVAALAGVRHQLLGQLADATHLGVGAAVVGLWLEGLQGIKHSNTQQTEACLILPIRRKQTNTVKPCFFLWQNTSHLEPCQRVLFCV